MVRTDLWVCEGTSGSGCGVVFKLGELENHAEHPHHLSRPSDHEIGRELAWRPSPRDLQKVIEFDS